MLQLEIITPEKIVYKNEVEEITVPTINGQITILPKHIGLLAQVIPGEITVRKTGSQYGLAITGGFLEVHNDSVSILADYAVRAEDIEILKAQEAQKRAEKLMEEKTSDQDFRIAQGELIKAITELKIATKHKRHSQKPPGV